MLNFLGNCQADFVRRVMQERGFDCAYHVQASPMTYPSHPGSIPPSLAAVDKAMGLGDYFHGRELVNQFCPINHDDTPPELIVMSLHHENKPLFINDEEKYVFFMDPRALNDKPEMMEWTQGRCKMFQPNPGTYFKRYGDMLAQMRADNPGVPILILSRLSHFPAFGPDPFSYLDGWGELGKYAPEVFESWTNALDDIHILDMNRVFGGIWAESDKRIESHCPFLKIKLEETNDRITGLHAQRDIEHIGPMPERLADKIADFLKTGTITYDANEIIPQEWNNGWQPVGLDETEMMEKLTSGANYLCAEAVAGFFLDLGRDYTPLLVAARQQMPVCHMTLHMIKVYSRIWRSPALAEWCDVHSEVAKGFTANGPLYQEAYIKRVREIREFVVG
ncbi:SGNH/GDSL hydrolase family protein [uncultured Pseudodesulfovibrio sp.]|uniref:SGNH/GDSL hydrolase family protein n=1 Tax=uncultured Pseudodesulfovibrio sp. TaxID=2035858 RepID=UPI0029C76927|nr:SGNH/GDSL hydrolase family protein [uncultured Pseudodesulfovibrio sp.]